MYVLLGLLLFLSLYDESRSKKLTERIANLTRSTIAGKRQATRSVSGIKS